LGGKGGRKKRLTKGPGGPGQCDGERDTKHKRGCHLLGDRRTEIIQKGGHLNGYRSKEGAANLSSRIRRDVNPRKDTNRKNVKVHFGLLAPVLEPGWERRGELKVIGVKT